MSMVTRCVVPSRALRSHFTVATISCTARTPATSFTRLMASSTSPKGTPESPEGDGCATTQYGCPGSFSDPPFGYSLEFFLAISGNPEMPRVIHLKVDPGSNFEDSPHPRASQVCPRGRLAVSCATRRKRPAFTRGEGPRAGRGG